MGPLSKKRKVAKVEEVTFDPAARHDFLTGFHKRKVQRAKHAQEYALKKIREEKIEGRKRLRQERAAQFEEAVEAHRKQLKILNEDLDGNDESGEDNEEENEEWEGFEEPPAVDYEAEYIDEDKYTTVTVEEMDASREGLLRSSHENDSDQEGPKEYPETAKLNEADKKKPKTSQPKKKKKKFRYESKEERQLTRNKQRLSKKKKADARRER